MLAAPRRLALRRAVRCLVLLSIVAPAAAQGSDRSIKLNDPLATEVGDGVVEARFSPDGAWVVYLATQDSGVPGLFGAPIDGSSPSRRLVSADGGPVSSWALSARNELVYTDWRRLYVVPLDGSRAPLPLTDGGDGNLPIGTFQVSASGDHVVYFTVSATGNWNGVFSVRTDGHSEPVRLFGPGQAERFVLDPRGERVVGHNTTSIFVVPIDGSADPLRVNGAGEWVPHYRALLFSPDGERLVYGARRGSLLDELWSTPLDGSQPPVKLNAPLQPNEQVSDCVISSDGTRVLYRARGLFGVPLDGSQPALNINGSTRGVGTYAFDADGQQALYLADEQAPIQAYELYLAPSDGSGTPRELLPRILDWTDSFALATESRRVVYRAAQGGLVDLYSVPLGHGEPIQLTHTSDPASGPWPGPALTPDGRTVVYLERVAPFDATWLELRAVSLDGTSDPVVLGGPFRLRTGGYPPPAPQIAPDGKHAILRIGLEVAGASELYSVPLDGHRPFAPVHPPLVTETEVDDVQSFQVAADGSRAFFTVRIQRGEPYHDPQTELYSVHLRPAAEPVLLHVTAPYHDIGRYASAGGNVVFVERIGDDEPDYVLRGVPADGSGPAFNLSAQGDGTSIPFHLTRDGSRAVFTLYDWGTTAGRIRSVPATGGPSIDLSGAPVQGGRVLNSRLSPDGARVVYAADALVAGVVELFSAPVDGSSPKVRLNAPFVAGRNVLTAFSYTEGSGYLISPDGSTVVYLADQESNDRFELYRVPIDGSAAPVKLNGALANGGDVQPDFRISADGHWIVYIADQITNNKNELFAGPLDGSAPAVRVSGPLAAGGQVQPDFQLDPARARVVYRADQLAGEVFELFSAPLDATEPAVRLNGPLVLEGDVSTGFVVGPDGQRVLFRADADADERFEAFGATLGVASSAVKLHENLAVGRDVLAGLRFSSNGAFALFVSDLEVGERFELWAAPSGGGKPWRVSGPFVPGGDLVRPAFLPWEYELPEFEPVPGRSSVLYLADQDSDEALELYLGRLGGPRKTPVSVPLAPRRR